VVLAWRLAYAATPSEAEVGEALAFLGDQRERFAGVKAKVPPERQALASFCQALLSSNRFLYVD
jgi:hypothetical protein